MQFERFDHVPNKEVAPLHMLHSVVMLGVVRQVTRSGVVDAERDRRAVAEAELVDIIAKEDALLGSLGSGQGSSIS